LLEDKYEFKISFAFQPVTHMSYLSIRNLGVRFGNHAAIHDLSLEAAKGEFLTLLGPSGCGKTTTLRAIAGFVTPSAGKILVDGADFTIQPVHKRNIGIVFQSYALFPHLTVLENVAFGLRMRHVPRTELQERATAALEMVGLPRLADRYPAQMSGGQQQRVAIARALVIEPAILLLDEPLSNLDANLRADLRQEIRALQRKLAITTILVTHDQQEALAVSDRIALLNEGHLVALGSPRELSEAPGDAFTAGFIGARMVVRGETRDGVFEAPGLRFMGAPANAIGIVLRSARLRLNNPGALAVTGRVLSHTYIGDWFETAVETPAGRVTVMLPSGTSPPAVGAECLVSAAAADVSFIS
jgi:putative spermidine/putrescine transport system ATP-binding protein